MERHIKAATTKTSGTRRVGRVFRNRLALTTILTVAPFVGYGRPALAASGCDPTGGTTYLCGGTNGATLAIPADNATVTTAAGFSVNSGAGNAITITGDGQLTFTDTNASSIISTDAIGLEVRSAGNDIEGEVTTNGGVTIRTNGNIEGASYGIFSRNNGSGNLSVTADGAVTGKSVDGIYAVNYGTDLTITTGADSVIYGRDEGIDAINRGEGNLKVTVNGRVSGQGNDGIFALNAKPEDPEGGPGGVDLTIITGARSIIEGGRNGVSAYNEASGTLDITIAGTVSGIGEGIDARNDGVDLKITTEAGSTVTSRDSEGIDAENNGDGELVVTINGDVTADDEGLEATNRGTDLKITTGAESVIAGRDGIEAENFGGGKLDIAVYGTVVGDDTGIEGVNSENGTALSVTTGRESVVWGVYGGINVNQRGSGDLTITVNGTVTSENGVGIRSGIDGPPDGSNETRITIGSTGRVEGLQSAIKAVSESGRDISITNYGLARNLLGNSAGLAIETDGGATDIENQGVLIGTLSLGISGEFDELEEANDDRLDNAGLWNTAGGTNRFANGRDEVINSGILVAADDATQVEDTDFFGLQEFNNTGGLISLIDGAVGDTLRLFGEGGGEVFDDNVDRGLTYLATDGRLAVDAVLGGGEAGESDILEIYGDVGPNFENFDNINEGGTTWVSVNVLDALGANLDGIPVVKVMGGSTGEGDFQLDGPLNAGFYTWDMRYDWQENVHELYTSGIGVGAYEFAAGITGAQDMWFQSTGLLMQRQADLRPLIAGMQVTPVADFAQPVEATPVAKVLPGFWMRGVGAWLDRDDEQDGFTLDRTQTVFGGMAGFDFGKENVGGQGDALMFGIFGGYLSSDLDFKESNTEWSYQGPSLGVYASYLTGAFYADATVKADFLNISIDPEDLAPAADESDTDGLNIGAMLDAGYKFGSGGGVFIEPQATLALLHTSIDDVDVFGGTVEFDDETSLRGRLGLRLGYDHTASNAVVYSSDVTASVWQNFSGENGATIVDPLIPAFGVADDPAQTYGDVSLGFSATAPEGWTGFLRGNYQFGDGYEAFAGNAGVRVAW